MVESGWAKVKESKDDSDRKNQLLELESRAREAKRGLWADGLEPVLTSYAPPSDLKSFIQTYKGKDVEALIEQVSNGSLLRIRMVLEPTQHQVVTLQMAGIRAPRAPANSEDVSNAEPCGAEARFFTESRLLQRNVSLELLGLPPNSAVSASPILVGVVKHPAGSISALLASYGFARCVDLHAALLGADRMADLRKAEADAKAARRGLWQSVALPASTASAGPTALTGGVKGKGYEALVTRVFSADTLFVRPGRDGGGAEKRISLASVRQPRPNDPKTGGLQLDAKEALRKRVIGKVVQVATDYIQPASGDFPEKEVCPTQISVKEETYMRFDVVLHCQSVQRQKCG